jgi:glycosyltransferase involved in cell wall biosynthesis
MKVLFVHDHGVHAAHRAWAESVGADFLDSNPRSLKGIALPIYSKLKRNKISEKYDVILAEGGTCLPMAIKLKKKFKAKIFMISADAMFYEMSTYGYARKKYISNAVKQLDGIIAVSSLSKQYAEKYVKCPIMVVNPFVNVEEFIKIRPKFDTKNIIFIGKHRPDKNIEGLIECFKEIKKDIPEATLTIIGGLNRQRLPKNLANENGLEIIDQSGIDVIKNKLASSKIFMHISWFDPCPVSVGESMAAGVPPLISFGVGSKDYVPKELVFDDGFSKHAIKLLNRDLRKLSQKCKKISKEYTKEKSQKKFKKAFSEMYKK